MNIWNVLHPNRLTSEECMHDANVNFEDELVHRTPSSRRSLRTVERSELKTTFFHATKVRSSSTSSIDELNYDELNNICICMVDIVGFSTWCSNHLPNIIARAMLDYNEWICTLINKYNGIKKIELVGDCCMIVGGTDHNEFVSLSDSYLSMIRLGVDMIEDIDRLKDVFKSKQIGIRIGIHVGDVIGIYLTDPHKYQMFGNDINVCSRLESSAIPNTLHVSEKTLMCVQNICKALCGPCSRCIKGKAINQSYKGIGFKTSYQLFLKKKAVYLVNFNPLFCKRMMEHVSDCEFVYELDEHLVVADLRSYKYNAVLVNVSPNQRSVPQFRVQFVVDSLITNPFFTQTVVMVTDSEHYQSTKTNYSYDFEHFLDFDSNDFYSTVQTLLDRFKTEFSEVKRGSLDLTISTDTRYV